MDTNTEKVDPTALALSRSIRKAEGGSYENTSGDNNTSAGAYQFNNGKLPLKKGEIPANFKSWATEQGLDPEDFSQTNQDHVAYNRIKKQLDDGLTQSQIAAKWNSGLTAGWENHKGTVDINGKKIAYDTPGYVSKVQKFYQDELSGKGTTSTEESDKTKKLSFDDINDAPPPSKETEPEKKDGLVKGLVKSLVGSPLTMLARPIQAVAALSGVPTEKIDEVSKKYSGGLVAPTPKGVKDVGKDVLRATETVALGYGGTKAATGLTKTLGMGPELSKPFISKILKGAVTEGETLTRDGAITRLTAYLNNMPASEVGSAAEKSVLKAIKELAPTLAEKQNLLAKIAKGGFNIAAKTALYNLLGDTLGGLVHHSVAK